MSALHGDTFVRDASDPDCGCETTASEKPAFTAKAERSVSRRWILGAGALGVVVAGAIGGPMLPAAFAATYPSWDDVQRAKGNEAAKASEVTRIEGLINQLQANVASTQAIAEQRSMEYFQAEEEYLAAVMRADDLQAQADAQGAAASAASERAGKVASQLYRSGGDDTSLELFFAGSASGADDLLGRLGRMDKALERNKDTFATAASARDAAQSLSDQASVARDERDRLKQVAEQKMVESQAAADAAQAALAAQSEHLIVLEAQLAALKDQTAQTVAGYQAGVEAKRKAEEEARRRAEEEARRLAAEAAARAAASNRGGGGGAGGGGASAGGGGGGGAGGQVGTAGWARPSSGRPSDRYGSRGTLCTPGYGCTGYHNGTDMSTGCGAGIFAASSGVVTYAAGNGQSGNQIHIDHGGGVVTRYSHIQNGGFIVGRGARVGAGQLIAREGATGLSYGCHLHFEVWINGGRTNPEVFMAARGIYI